MNNLNKLPGKDLVSETSQGSFIDAFSNPNPGFVVMEQWRDIPGWEGFYQVSNIGNVRSLDRTILVKKPNCNKPTDVRYKGKKMKPRLQSMGYYAVTLAKRGADHPDSIHRLVARAFIPNPENKRCVNHINCVKTDNRVENLEWCTYKENIQHSFNNGIHKRGNDHYRSKLNSFQVRVIRKINDMDQNEIARIFGVGQSNICAIKVRRTWKHIKSDPVQTKAF